MPVILPCRHLPQLLLITATAFIAGCDTGNSHRYPGSHIVFETYSNANGTESVAATTTDAITSVGAWYTHEFAHLQQSENIGSDSCFRRSWQGANGYSATLTACDHDNLHTLWLTQTTGR